MAEAKRVEDHSRYHRQILLPAIGEEGQRRLAESHAVVVGVGALGCGSADMLARAGFGRITLIDRDVVEITNLQRQTLYGEGDVGVPKAEAARRRLCEVNSMIEVRAVIADVTGSNAERVIRIGGQERPLLIDGTDNFETRYLLNDLAVSRGLAYFYGGAVGVSGLAMTIVPGKTPCLRCVFPEPPPAGSAPTCDTAGVLGPVVAMVAARQAAEAIRFAARCGRDETRSVLWSIDGWNGTCREVDVSAAGPSAGCPCCGLRRFEYLEGDAGADAVSLCGQNAVQISPPRMESRLDLAAFAEELREHGRVELTPYMLRAMLPAPGETGVALEMSLFEDGRAIIRGTSKAEVARTVYARYVGH